ncbi:hypothetical protein [Pleionea sediminis]|uniref:hypothetical protein n=1 Tax=Pleionea sediminis TaxID=2569479 RepID=UPI00118519AC|nr:hypothetical protein [Pleionea sediminis]
MNITTFKTLVLRETWENKSLTLAPLVISAVMIFSLIVGLISGQMFISGEGLDDVIKMEMPDVEGFEGKKIALVIQAMMGGPLLIGMLFVLFFYSLGSLYNDRQDRSILFWKSMPVSDLQTVMSKVFTAMVVAPLITALVALATQLLSLILFTPVIWMNGGSAWSILWAESSLLTVMFNDIAIALMVGLWMAPVLGWLWFVSAIAKRSAFLIAVFAPLGIMLVEGMILRSAHFAKLIGQHFSQIEYIVQGTIESGHPFTLMQSSGFWIGLVVAAMFIGLAVYIRRFRDDSY